MDIDFFRDNIEFKFDLDVLKNIIDKAIMDKGDFASNLLNFTEMFNYNSETSLINSEDFKYFLDRKISGDFKKNNPHEEISRFILTNNRICLPILRILGSVNSDPIKFHSIYINTSGENTIGLVKSIYELFKYRRIDAQIELPLYKNICNGLKNQITIKCDTLNLESALKALNALDYCYKEKIEEPNEMIGRFGKYGYEFKNTSKLLGRIILRSLLDAIKTWSYQNQDKRLDADKSIQIMLEENPESLRDITAFIIEKDSNFIEGLYRFIKNNLGYENLDINHIYDNKDFISELDTVYKTKQDFDDEKISSNELYQKYFGIIDDVSVLDENVLDENEQIISVYDYFEKSDILNKIPYDALIYLNEGECITGSQFINKFVVPQIKIFKGILLEDIIDKYVSSIEKKKVKK